MRQAINQGTLFAVSDGNSPHEIFIGGEPRVASVNGSIFLEENDDIVSVSVPYAVLNTDQSSTLTHYIIS